MGTHYILPLAERRKGGSNSGRSSAVFLPAGNKVKAWSAAVGEAGIAQREGLFFTADSGRHNLADEDRVVAAAHFVHHTALEPRRRVHQHRRAGDARLKAEAVDGGAGRCGAFEKATGQLALAAADDVHGKNSRGSNGLMQRALALDPGHDERRRKRAL